MQDGDKTHGCSRTNAFKPQNWAAVKKMGAQNGFFEESSETAHDASARSHRALPNGGAVTKIPRTRAAEFGASFSQRGGAEEAGEFAAAA